MPQSPAMRLCYANGSFTRRGQNVLCAKFEMQRDLSIQFPDCELCHYPSVRRSVAELFKFCKRSGALGINSSTQGQNPVTNGTHSVTFLDASP